MKRLTQTELSPGNCWQTGVAALLDLHAEALPPQTAIELAHKSDSYYAGHFSFSNALNAYLYKHHRLAYAQLPIWQMAQAKITGYHLIIGTTVRTVENMSGQPRILHCVVGAEGEEVWDVHPSQAGLLRPLSYGFLLRPDPEHFEHRETRIAHELTDWRSGKRRSQSYLCCCPACFADGEYQ